MSPITTPSDAGRERSALSDGHVGETRVLRSLDTKYGLDLEAIRACQAWTFEAAQLHGSPVPLIVTMEMSFTLK